MVHNVARTFPTRYNDQSLIEKNGDLSRLDARARASTPTSGAPERATACPESQAYTLCLRRCLFARDAVCGFAPRDLHRPAAAPYTLLHADAQVCLTLKSPPQHARLSASGKRWMSPRLSRSEKTPYREAGERATESKIMVSICRARRILASSILRVT